MDPHPKSLQNPEATAPITTSLTPIPFGGEATASPESGWTLGSGRCVLAEFRSARGEWMAPLLWRNHDTPRLASPLLFKREAAGLEPSRGTRLGWGGCTKGWRGGTKRVAPSGSRCTPQGSPAGRRGADPTPRAPLTANLPPQVNEVCSPTKPAAPFSPESWYRKAYEESRASSRPTPEGAGSALGSSGTPSPGSGTSSPSSFTGSPGPASPGIGTSSPGSLGGSPGFGTGSPGSGSGGGSSPGSDRGVWCENCNARLVELKRQALKLLLPGPFPGKVS